MMATTRIERPLTSPQRGMVLVIVLWIVTLLAVMAGGFAYSMRVETRLATTAVERAQARALAEAGMAYALAWQLDPELQKQWPPNGDPHDWTFGGGRLRIQVTDASGLVDLNNARPEVLKALLAGVGVAADDQDRLADAIQDWRDFDDQPLTHGAEKTEYRAAGRPGPKDANFDSVDELGQVLGVTRELHERLAGVTTVFSLSATVSPELAPAAVLQALGLDERTIADYVTARARTAADGSAAPPVSLDDSSALFSSGGRSGVYHIKVAAETEGGTAIVLEAVFKGPGGMVGWGAVAEQSPRLVSWREGW
ncbi:MAG TPA: type II secretion system protein GspK [Candidatus Contendobacter sp.]|nr:type II secretion system protein GspK [Candidatus Contendobacter sp.]